MGVADVLATRAIRLNFAGSLGYLDAKFKEFITLVTRNESGATIPASRLTSPTTAKSRTRPNGPPSGTLNYDTPLGSGGDLNLNSTLHYRSKSQQFEIATPGLDQKGFRPARRQHRLALAGGHWTMGCTARI